jgi:hypothetical protein
MTSRISLAALRRLRTVLFAFVAMLPALLAACNNGSGSTY